MAAPNPRILWGPNYENELVFAHPPYSPVTDREPREGSEWQQGASGTEDAWITGRDYTLEFDARFLEHDQSSAGTPLGGPTGWQAFLDACRDKQPFRFVPDEAVPDFYVPDCQLVEPMRGFGEMRDYRRGVHLKIRNPAVDFVQALRGLMFEYAPGGSLTDPVAATFSRASAATYRGKPGSLAAAVGASAASGVLRDRHYEGALRTTLLEAARTQVVTDPENFGNWTNLGTPVVTAGQADPFGGTAAYLIEDDAGGGEGKEQAVSFTGDGTKSQSIFLKAGTAGQLAFRLWDNTAATYRHYVIVTWTAGVPALATGSGSGLLGPAENWGGGWWRIPISADAVVAANSNRVQVVAYFTSGTFYIFGANAWDAAVPSSYQGPSLGTRNADLLSYPFTYPPQGMFVYGKGVERGTIKTPGGFGRLFEVGAEFPSNRFLVYQSALDEYAVFHDNPLAGSARSSAVQPGTAIGDPFEWLALLYPTGAVQLRTSKNGAADIVGAQSTASRLGSAWGLQKLSIDSDDGGAQGGFLSLAGLKIGPLTFGGVTVDTIAKARTA